jgi:hypothetical protein
MRNVADFVYCMNSLPLNWLLVIVIIIWNHFIASRTPFVFRELKNTDVNQTQIRSLKILQKKVTGFDLNFEGLLKKISDLLNSGLYQVCSKDG